MVRTRFFAGRPDGADGPVEDIFWTDEDYQEVYKRAGLVPINTYRPLANRGEPGSWVSETKIAPWVIYVFWGGQ